VRVLGDEVDEPHEEAYVDAAVDEPTPAVLLDRRGTLTIVGDDFCARSPGYWKLHPEQWPVEYLILGDLEYDQPGLLELLDTSGSRDMANTVARHLIAVELDLAAGSDPLILPDVEEAHAYLAEYPPGSNPRRADRARGEELEMRLDAYYDPTCGDDEEE
jgi:hypothetical protein